MVSNWSTSFDPLDWSMFFWIGWHARGGVEDSDDMLKMME
jgi:hypothetical protein